MSLADAASASRRRRKLFHLFPRIPTRFTKVARASQESGLSNAVIPNSDGCRRSPVIPPVLANQLVRPPIRRSADKNGPTELLC